MKPHKVILAYVALLSISFSCLHAKNVKSESEDIRLIKKTIQYYFFGAYIHNVEKLAEAYHPQAQLTYVDVETGKYNNLHVGQYLSSMKNTEFHNAKQELKIQKIDITGKAAMVRTQILFPTQGKRVNDLLSLLKIEKEWRIVRRTSYKEYASFKDGPISAKKQSKWVNDHEGIQLVIKKYMTDSDKCNLETMKTYLHPDVAFTYVDPRKGTFHKIYMENYLDLHQEAATRKYKRHYEIVSVEIAGNTAIAKVRVKYRKQRTSVTDYISFVQIRGKWKIIHKSTHKEAGAMLIPV